MNMKINAIDKRISQLFKLLGSAFRIRLLYSIGYGEVCVCHLEAVLRKRQAYISQHLMLLRDTGILEARREGKYIFYRVSDPTIFDLLREAAIIQSIPTQDLPEPAGPGILSNCACPKCEPDSNANQN
jgi:ArsR family transcriptional regulator